MGQVSKWRLVMPQTINNVMNFCHLLYILLLTIVVGNNIVKYLFQISDQLDKSATSWWRSRLSFLQSCSADYQISQYLESAFNILETTLVWYSNLRRCTSTQLQERQTGTLTSDMVDWSIAKKCLVSVVWPGGSSTDCKLSCGSHAVRLADRTTYGLPRLRQGKTRLFTLTSK